MVIQYSIQKMVSDGTLSTIALGIQYLQRNDIYIRIAGEDTPQSGAPSGYTWSFLDNTTLKILPVVPNGVEVVVYRRTDVDAMYNIYSQNAQFDEATIDENNQQLLYIAQEYLEQGLPGTGVDTIEYVRDDGSFTYYRMRRTDGSYSEEFTVPSASNSTKVLTRESLRRSYAEAGYNLADGSFEAGGTLVNANDVLLQERTGKAFSGPAGAVAAGTNPTSGGFVDRSGMLLRNIPAPNNTTFLSTLSDIAQGAEIHISRFLPESARSAIFDGTSTADLTQYVQDAVDSGSSAITFANVKKLNVGEVNLPDTDVMLLGRGGNINGISGGRIFKATARGKLTTIEGVVFTGNATAYDYASNGGTVPHGSQLYEYVLSNNRYLMQGNIPAIRLYGAREGVIFGGYMLANQGIYTEFSINTSIIGLQAKNCDYVVLSKLGSEGLICSHLVALGCSYGLRCERTTGVQLTNSMLDYCDLPLRMVGATDVEVSNNYLSTRTKQGVLHLSTYTDGFRGLRHKYIGNTMQSNYNAAGDVVAILNDNDYVDFVLNTVRGFTGTGVKYDNLTQSDIAFNKIIGKGTDAGERSIYCSGTDSPSVNVERNRVTSKIERTHYASTSKNAGFRTEASGTATVPNGAVSVTVPHGLPIKPTADKIRLTAGGGAISGRQLYVNNVTATTFDIQVAGGAVTANLPVFWAISNIL